MMSSLRLITRHMPVHTCRCYFYTCVLKIEKLWTHAQTTPVVKKASYNLNDIGSTLIKGFCSFPEEKEHHLLSVNAVVDKYATVLADQSIPEARESVELFVAHVMGKSTLHGVSTHQVLSLSQVDKVKVMVRQRLEREPVQYIIGEWDFCDLVLKMKQPVFIPRPETEELVGFIKSHLKEKGLQKCCILEVGCGSGAITLALLKEFPMMHAVAIDKTETACQLTDVNARKYGLLSRLDIFHRDLNEDVSDLGQFDLIVSNPPYISTKDIGQLDPQVSRYEDRGALDGGGDGLDVVRILLNKSPALLKPHGTLWLEVDTVHPAMIQHMVSHGHYPGLQYRHSLQDFTSRPRFCVLQVSDEPT